MVNATDTFHPPQAANQPLLCIAQPGELTSTLDAEVSLKAFNTMLKALLKCGCLHICVSTPTSPTIDTSMDG